MTTAWPRWTGGAFAARLAHPRRTALACNALYLLLALLWILVTDRLVNALAGSRAELETFQFAKGLLFVLGSAVLGYAVLSRPLVRLSESEQRWRHVMHALDDVTWVASPDGAQILYLNEAAEAVFGRAPAEFLADPGLWSRVVHTDDRAALAVSSRAIQAGATRTLEYRIVRPDGALRWLRDRASMIRADDGRPIALVGVASDITGQRQMQDEANEAYRRLDGIVESAMDAIITVDDRQIVQVFNRAAGEVFGVRPDEALGQPLDRFIPPGHRSAHRVEVAAFAESGATHRRMGHLMPLSGVRADGTEFPAEASISRSGDGDRRLMTVILRDVSAMRRVEQADRARAEADAANHAKSEFLARMSHELRTPLNAVIGFSQLMLADRTDPLARRQAGRVERIRQAGWHLLALINDVLDLSRLESDRLVVETTTVSLPEVIGEARAMCQGLADQHGVSIVEVPWSGPALHARADALRLRQVLVNLLSNAIKYNRNEGSTWITMGMASGRVFVQIRDTGVGMTPEQLQHLYEPFNRLGREHSGIEGTGIGLVLARQLVGLMAGDLDIVSEPERGTTVTVVLPHDATGGKQARGPFEDTGAAPLDAHDPRSSDGDLQGRVLYIEGNPVDVALIEQVLARWPGVRLTHARDAASGIAMARATRPDLVLLDMRPPDMDGLEVLRHWRQDASLQRIPVVALSAGLSSDDLAAARNAGAEELWAKPLDLRRVEGSIAQWLGSAGAGRGGR